MRFKLTNELCYFAGMTKGPHESEKNRLGFTTVHEQLTESFIKHALALGVNPTKMMIETQEHFTHVYFYHSRVARMVNDILEKREALPKKNIGLAVSFAAGMFDSSGHASNGRVFIRRMDKKDALMLELMGIHTSGSGKVINAKHFLEMIKEQSFIARKLLS
jgi:hypothetical protein